MRLLQKGRIVAAWGASENNRKAKFYSITERGRKQLSAEAENWHEAGDTLDEFPEQFPTVTREIAIEALETAKNSLLAAIE